MTTNESDSTENTTDAQRRTEATQDAHHKAAACASAIQAAALGEPDPNRRRCLTTAYAAAFDLATNLAALRELH